MTRIATAVAAAFTLLATSAPAATVDVVKTHSSNIFKDENGQNAWYVATKFSVGQYNSGRVGAGAFRLTDASGNVEDFIAFCLQPLEWMRTPKTYTMGSLFSDVVTQNLQTLAGNAMALVTDSRSAAAFQMAAWEITTETSMTFDVDDGFFKITGDRTASNDAEDLAQIWLNNIQDDIWTATPEKYLMLHASGTQDLLTDVQVMPLPASSLMLLSGLVGVGALARRRQKAK